ncbi:bifunctional metallophosphatase/5'-nucleotidase, partial [Streptomyces cavourensis]
LHSTLTVGDLLATEPFDNHLVNVTLSDDQQHVSLVASLPEPAGPFITAPAPLPAGIRTVLTTDYLPTRTSADSPHTPSSLLARPSSTY